MVGEISVANTDRNWTQTSNCLVIMEKVLEMMLTHFCYLLSRIWWFIFWNVSSISVLYRVWYNVIPMMTCFVLLTARFSLLTSASSRLFSEILKPLTWISMCFFFVVLQWLSLCLFTQSLALFCVVRLESWISKTVHSRSELWPPPAP